MYVKDDLLPKCKVTDSLRRWCCYCSHSYHSVSQDKLALREAHTHCPPLFIPCSLQSSRKLVHQAVQPFAFWRWQQLWKNLQFHSGLMRCFCVLNPSAELLPQGFPQDRCDSRDNCWESRGHRFHHLQVLNYNTLTPIHFLIQAQITQFLGNDGTAAANLLQRSATERLTSLCILYFQGADKVFSLLDLVGRATATVSLLPLLFTFLGNKRNEIKVILFYRVEF